MCEKVKIELTRDQLTVIIRALNLMAQQHFELAVECNDEDVSERNFKAQEEYEKLKSEMGCITINVVGKCERNVWNGSVSPQIIIEDYEIVGEQKYYF